MRSSSCRAGRCVPTRHPHPCMPGEVGVCSSMLRHRNLPIQTSSAGGRARRARCAISVAALIGAQARLVLRRRIRVQCSQPGPLACVQRMLYRRVEMHRSCTDPDWHRGCSSACAWCAQRAGCQRKFSTTASTGGRGLLCAIGRNGNLYLGLRAPLRRRGAALTNSHPPPSPARTGLKRPTPPHPGDASFLESFSSGA